MYTGQKNSAALVQTSDECDSGDQRFAKARGHQCQQKDNKRAEHEGTKNVEEKGTALLRGKHGG